MQEKFNKICTSVKLIFIFGLYHHY